MFQSSEVLPAASAARAVSGRSSSFEEILKPFGADLSQPTAHLAAAAAALFAVKPNQLLRLKAAGQAISSSFCLV